MASHRLRPTGANSDTETETGHRNVSYQRGTQRNCGYSRRHPCRRCKVLHTRCQSSKVNMACIRCAQLGIPCVETRRRSSALRRLERPVESANSSGDVSEEECGLRELNRDYLHLICQLVEALDRCTPSSTSSLHASPGAGLSTYRLQQASKKDIYNHELVDHAREVISSSRIHPLPTSLPSPSFWTPPNQQMHCSRAADDFYNSFTDAPTAIEDRDHILLSESTTTPPPPSESSSGERFSQDQPSTSTAEVAVSSEEAHTSNNSSRAITPVSLVISSMTGGREEISDEEDPVPLNRGAIPSQPEAHQFFHLPSFSTFNLDEVKLTTCEPLNIRAVRVKRVQISIWKDHLLDAARWLKAGRQFRPFRRFGPPTRPRANGDSREPDCTSTAPPEEMDEDYFDLNLDYLNLSLKYLSLVNDFAQALGADTVPPVWNEPFHETTSILSTSDTSSSEASHPNVGAHHSTSHSHTEKNVRQTHPSREALQRRLEQEAWAKVLREAGLFPPTGLVTPKRNDHTHRRNELSLSRLRKMFERIRV